MSTEGGSFLPRILSVFYVAFHEKKGPCIVYQVPEGLISGPHQASTSTPPASNEVVGSPSEASTSTAVSRASSRTRHSRIRLEARAAGDDSGSNSPSGGRENERRERPSLKRSGEGRSTSASTSVTRTLFHFEDISHYVMPHSILCGRLVTCATRHHRVLGFPVELYGKRYERNYFRFNVCFAFERTADLSCYEPIVRKIGRVLTACEEESSFLSSPETAPKIYTILEQLYEDLNSYSETSIPIDKFNSIELKIFPFYPNPPPVHDWCVPVALINLKKRIEDNWDLTMAKICPFVDGTNHVSRIAHLADCDIQLTRKAISHLLYYQVIMMIDIFQFSNMYTLCRSIQWLADEAHVRDECGPYVTRPDREIPDWPDLLHLYSRLKPGITAYEWMQEYGVDQLGIDPRRFVSFGVIKGFLRRVHRWPALVPGSNTNMSYSPPLGMKDSHDSSRGRRSPIVSIGRRRGRSFIQPAPAAPASSPTGPGGAGVLAGGVLYDASTMPPTLHLRSGAVDSAGAGPVGSGTFELLPTSSSSAATRSTAGISRSFGARQSGFGPPREQVTSPSRRASAAEKYLENFRRALDASASSSGANNGQKAAKATTTSPHGLRFPGGPLQQGQHAATSTPAHRRDERHRSYSLQQPTASAAAALHIAQAQAQLYGNGHAGGGGTDGSEMGSGNATPALTPTATGAGPLAGGRQRHSRSPTVSMSVSGSAHSQSYGHGHGYAHGHLHGYGQGAHAAAQEVLPPPGLAELLDGTRHTDELGVRFEAGWPLLERWLVAIGGGKGDGDFGRVVVIFR